MHAYCERHAYEMAPVRGTPMRWPMKDARLWETCLWDGFCEKHAYKRRVCEMAAYERRTYEMAYGRCTPMRDKPMRWPVIDTRLWEKHAYERCMPMR
jgi:hypothetical protein